MICIARAARRRGRPNRSARFDVNLCDDRARRMQHAAPACAAAELLRACSAPCTHRSVLADVYVDCSDDDSCVGRQPEREHRSHFRTLLAGGLLSDCSSKCDTFELEPEFEHTRAT